MTDIDELASNIKRYWESQDTTLGATLPLTDARTTEFREHPVWMGVIDGLLRTGEGERPIRRVADLGSGLGNVTELIARLGYHVIGVDFSESRSAKAIERLENFPNAEVRIGNVMDPPIEAGEVDAVISRNLIWLLPDPTAAVARWAQIAGPGARIAAVESTHRTDRHRLPTLQKTLKLIPPAGNASGPSPVTSRSATPLASVSSMSEPRRIWADAHLTAIEISDLGWVTAARQHHWPMWKRLLRRDDYFAISGVVGALS